MLGTKPGTAAFPILAKYACCFTGLAEYDHVGHDRYSQMAFLSVPELHKSQVKMQKYAKKNAVSQP